MEQTPANQSSPAAPADAHAPPPEPAPPAAQAAPGAWQAPVFWMACGGLLVGLVVGGILVAQRVGVERDMAAVAVTLAPPVGEVQRAAPASERPPTAAADPLRAAPTDSGAGAAAPPPLAAKPAGRTAMAGKPKQHLSSRHVASTDAQRSRPPARRRPARKLAAQEKDLYWDVFKRCPLPGEPGAVECRRHICNGAESEGPACKPYRGKWR